MFTMFIRGHECKVVGEFEPRDESVGIMRESFVLEYVISLEWRIGALPRDRVLRGPVLQLQYEELTPGEVRDIERVVLEHDKAVRF